MFGSQSPLSVCIHKQISYYNARSLCLFVCLSTIEICINFGFANVLECLFRGTPPHISSAAWAGSDTTGITHMSATGCCCLVTSGRHCLPSVTVQCYVTVFVHVSVHVVTYYMMQRVE